MIFCRYSVFTKSKCELYLKRVPRAVVNFSQTSTARNQSNFGRATSHNLKRHNSNFHLNFSINCSTGTQNKSKEMQKLYTKIARGLSSRTKFSALCCRSISQTEALFGEKPSENDGSTNTPPVIKWDKLYHMEEINYLGIVSKLKRYQSIASAAMLPVAYIGETLNHVPDGVTMIVLAMCA